MEAATSASSERNPFVPASKGATKAALISMPISQLGHWKEIIKGPRSSWTLKVNILKHTSMFL